MTDLIERETVVDALRFLAAARKEYCHRCPEHQGDMAAMSPLDLAVHEEHATADWLADIFAGTNDAKGWLPSWRWDEWHPYTRVLTPGSEKAMSVEPRPESAEKERGAVEVAARALHAYVCPPDGETCCWNDEGDITRCDAPENDLSGLAAAVTVALADAIEAMPKSDLQGDPADPHRLMRGRTFYVSWLRNATPLPPGATPGGEGK